MAVALARLHGASHLNRTAEQQQLFGQGGLAGIGVRNDRKRASPVHFAGNPAVRHVLVWSPSTVPPKPGSAKAAHCTQASGIPTG